MNTNAKSLALVEHDNFETYKDPQNSIEIFYMDALDEEILNLIQMQRKVIQQMKNILSNGNGITRTTEDFNNE